MLKTHSQIPPSARARLALFLCGAFIVPAAAVADPQSPPAPAPAQAAAPPGGKVEQIIVNAKKRKQNVQKVPQTVDVVRASTLHQYGAKALDDLQNFVSGLVLNDNGGQGQNITLRGITYNPDTTANPAIDLYVNEVPISQTSSAFQDMFDVDQVEVIRGPQGTLRGRTSPAGAILIDTQKPDMDNMQGYVSQMVSDDALWRTELAASEPIIPGKLAIRVAGLFDQNDSYQTTDPVSGKKDYTLQHDGRLTIEAKPNDDIDIVLMAQSSNDRNRQLLIMTGSGSEGTLTPADNIALTPGPYTFYDRTDLVTLQATWHLADSSIVYTGGYQAVKDEFQNYEDPTNYLPGFDIGSEALDNGLEQFTQEILWQSTGQARLQYMGGLYYAHQDALATVFTPSETIFTPSPQIPIGEINATVTIPQLVTDYAIFTDETYNISDHDIIEGGLRWQFENQYRANDLTAVAPPSFLGGFTVNEALVSPQNQHEEYRAWTGLASYTHAFTDNFRLYASYGESFRPGGIVLGISVPLPENFLLFKPETSYDFEIGVKTDWDDGRLRVNGDIFHQTYSNYIGRINGLYTIYGYQDITTNGNAVAAGAELSASYEATENWRFNANATYSDAHYDNARLPCNDFSGSGAPNEDGTPRVIGNGIASYCTTDGSLNAPPLTTSASTEYAYPITEKFDGFVRALYTFSSAAILSLGTGNQDPRNLVNLYAGVRGSQSAWEVALFAKNIFDTVGYNNLGGQQHITGYTTEGQPIDYFTGYDSAKILRPRELGAYLTYRF